MAKWLQERFKKLDKSKGSLDQDLDQMEVKKRTCPRCGFDGVEPDHKYCMRCGVDLKKEEAKI